LEDKRASWYYRPWTTVHILYGTAEAEDPNRLKEIQDLAGSIAVKSNNAYEWSRNFVLLGDFNIFSKTFKVRPAMFETTGFPSRRLAAGQPMYHKRTFHSGFPL